MSSGCEPEKIRAASCGCKMEDSPCYYIPHLLLGNDELHVRFLRHSFVGHKGGMCVCRREIMGLILVKELALLDPESGTLVRDVKMRPLPMLRADTAMCAHLPPPAVFWRD